MSPPDQRERRNISRIKGRMAAPVAVAEYPWTWIKFNGNRKKKIPMAAYRKRVSKFAPVKLRDAKSVRGTIGEVVRISTQPKVVRHPKPTSRLPITSGC